ncbi:MAG TPA: phage holin family protein [Thermoleophilaceae bacterium]|nr:phage holin family protein [Thermoleophilaceae bacterium]
MSENGTTQQETANKDLGEIVGNVSKQTSLLVSEEIALAKAEVAEKATKLGKGVAGFALAGFFALMMLVFLLHTLSYGFADWLGVKTWVGYGITTVLLLLLTGLAAFIGLRFVKKGAPPTPDMAIEEAKKTQLAIKEARS